MLAFGKANTGGVNNKAWPIISPAVESWQLIWVAPCDNGHSCWHTWKRSGQVKQAVDKVNVGTNVHTACVCACVHFIVYFLKFLFCAQSNLQRILWQSSTYYIRRSDIPARPDPNISLEPLHYISGTGHNQSGFHLRPCLQKAGVAGKKMQSWSMI